jgi:uncharacterized protein (DUF3820 family)
MIISFGKYKGHDTSAKAVPDSYIGWLARRGAYYKPENRFETDWKVPIALSIEARREMERRGYRRVDDHYERKDKS